MKKLAAAIVIALIAAQGAMANTSWSTGGSYAYLNNGVGDTYYDLDVNSANADFTGNLGSFNPGYTLFLNAEVNANADGGDAYTAMRLHWRIDGGAFSVQTAGSINSTGGSGFRGNATGADLSGLSAGTHTIELFLSRSHTWGGGGPYTTYLGSTGDTGGGVEPGNTPPTGNFFTAQFRVVPEPSTLAMAGLGLLGLVVRRRMVK